MNQSALKNMVVLKNLPSNIVEEAIIVLKTNNKVKQNEKVEKNVNKNEKNIEKTKENDYIFKEAEMLVSNYITRLEQKKKERNEIQKTINKKCKKLKKSILVMSIILLLETVLLVIK